MFGDVRPEFATYLNFHTDFTHLISTHFASNSPSRSAKNTSREKPVASPLARAVKGACQAWHEEGETRNGKPYGRLKVRFVTKPAGLL
jgi:hypothetical protein